MTDDLDFIPDLPRPTSARTGRGRTFDDGLQGATRSQAARASGRSSVTRGRYVQMTFRLPEEVVERFSRMAVEAGVSQEDLKRWLVWRGLQAWADGERPETDEDVVRRVRVEWGGSP